MGWLRDARLPKDAVMWMKHEGNSYSDAYETTSMELLDRCPDVHAAWEAWVEETNFNRNACPASGTGSF